MSISRRHHYVWRKYLRPWATNEKIFCSRLGTIFKSNLMEVGQERGFYKIKPLNENDIAFVKMFIEKFPAELKYFHNQLLEFHIKFSRINKISENPNNIKAEIKQEIGEFLNETAWNFGENFQGGIENIGDEYLNSALNENVDFFYTDEGFMLFVYYLCVQYMRTKRIKEGILLSFREVDNLQLGSDIENTLFIINDILSINMSYSFCLDRSNLKLIQLFTTEDDELITTDQPVINIHGTGKNAPTSPDKIAFYYPISPKSALLMTEDEKYKDLSKIYLSKKETELYNNLMVKNSYEQIYASNEHVLRRL